LLKQGRTPQYCYFKAIISEDLVAFSHRIMSQDLIGYVGRALTEKDLFLREYDFPSNIKKSWLLWNYHRIKGKNKLLQEKGLIVVEGFHDVLRHIQYGRWL